MEENCKYRVTIYYSETFEVEAGNEDEAQHKAYQEFKSSFNCSLIPDEYEIECLDEDD